MEEYAKRRQTDRNSLTVMSASDFTGLSLAERQHLLQGVVLLKHM
jgi:hypothetical protein